MPTLRQCAEDKSWRVRYMVADKFTELQVIGLLLFFFRIYEYMIQLCCCFSVRITNIWCNHLSVACPGCCWKRDHKDRPGASLPISAERLRSRGRFGRLTTLLRRSLLPGESCSCSQSERLLPGPGQICARTGFN